MWRFLGDCTVLFASVIESQTMSDQLRLHVHLGLCAVAELQAGGCSRSRFGREGVSANDEWQLSQLFVVKTKTCHSLIIQARLVSLCRTCRHVFRPCNGCLLDAACLCLSQTDCQSWCELSQLDCLQIVATTCSCESRVSRVLGIGPLPA